MRIIFHGIKYLALAMAAVFLLLVALWSSGEESFSQGIHLQVVHASAFKPLKKCKYNGAMGPCGCPLEVNADPVISGDDKQDVVVTSTKHPFEPGTVVKWHVKHLVICAAYENYEPAAGVFRNVRIKTGKTSGEATISHELVDVVLWMRPKR